MDLRGFYNINKLGIAVNYLDDDKYIYEIINQCSINKINIKIKILLTNENVITL